MTTTDQYFDEARRPTHPPTSESWMAKSRRRCQLASKTVIAVTVIATYWRDHRHFRVPPTHVHIHQLHRHPAAGNKKTTTFLEPTNAQCTASLKVIT